MPPFTGGLTGYFSYEFITYAEPSLHLSAEDDEGISNLDLMVFDKVIVFDNLKQKIQLIVNVRLDDAEENYNRACLEIRRMKTLIKDGNPAPENPLILQSEFTPLFSREAYCCMVEKGKQYIHEGDIFQVVLSNRLEAKAKGSLLDTYRVLRTLNPSPYMFSSAGVMWKLPALHRKHSPDCRMESCIHSLSRDPDPEAATPKRMPDFVKI